MPKPVIVVDTREREILRLFDQEKADIQEKQLIVGDFILSERVGVERKRVSDFLQSIVDARLFSQIESLASTFERPLLILEGNPEMLFLERQMHANTIRGVLASITIDYQVPIIWTSSIRQTADQLYWIAHREQVMEKREIAVRANKKAPSLSVQQEYLIAGLPGINTKRAKQLLEQFKTPERVFKATNKQLLKIDGFGEKTIQKLKELLQTEYSVNQR